MEKLEKSSRMIGKVISNKMDKTVVVKVERLVMHSRYKKTFKKTSKFKSHDEKNECKVGDLVRIAECRPLSKGKKTRVVEIIEKAGL